MLIRDLVIDDDSEPSPFLKGISDQFSECCKGHYRVISFFERKSSPTIEVRYLFRLVTWSINKHTVETAGWSLAQNRSEDIYGYGEIRNKHRLDCGS
jgi:hypothetical protein